MADTFIDSVVTPASKTPVRMAAAPLEEMFDERGRPSPTSDKGPSTDVSETGGESGRVLSDSTKSLFAKIREARAAERGDDDDDPDAPANETDDETAASASANDGDPDAPPGEAPPPKADAAKASAATEVKPPSPEDELRERISRFEAQNRALVAELDAEKKKPKSVVSEPQKKLLEASTNYVDDQIAALRVFVAHSLGIEDTSAPEVEAELRDLYADLTAKELGTTLDPAHQAKREAARAKQLFAREKRQRKADEEHATQRAQADAETQRIAQAGEFIGPRLKLETYPLLHALSKSIDGATPGELVARVLQREMATGAIDPKQPDEKLIEAAALIAEKHYQSIAEVIGRTKPSTAPPNDSKSSAAGQSARTEQRQSHGARNLTSADASVTPTTPPATKPKSKDERPEFKNDEERKKWALRHLRKKR